MVWHKDINNDDLIVDTYSIVRGLGVVTLFKILNVNSNRVENIERIQPRNQHDNQANASRTQL
jgi:hypothetical protein